MDAHLVFAECLAAELGTKASRRFIAASDRVLVRLWMEGYRIGPLDDVVKDLDADCGHRTPDYLCWEREGKTYCEACFAKRLKTPHGRSYEKWFARD